GKAFCAGGDVGRMGQGDPTALDNKNQLWEGIHRVPKTLEQMDKPVIAMINGVAVGAGMGMSVMCDLRIAADTARFSTGYVRVGLVPGDGDTYFLPRLTGTAKALELLWTADFIEAPKALELGIVNRVVPADKLAEETYALAHQIADGPQIPIRMIKRLVYQSMRLDLRTHLDLVSSHETLAPSWFDPSTAPPQITPFGVLYAVHDALVRPLPGQKMGASLAESWTESRDGLVYEFKLRRGLKFHNGDPLTTDDVKFSFERYQGAGASELRARVRQVEIVDPLTVRFHLKEAWPDFMTFYGTTATGAGLVLPRKYFEQVGVDGFKQRPVGAGPYQFVSQRPGVDVVLEAFPGYWRHAPYIKRLTLKSVPDGTTRL